MKVGQGFGVWGFDRCVAGLFFLSVTCLMTLDLRCWVEGPMRLLPDFSFGSFLTGLSRPNGLLGFTRT